MYILLLIILLLVILFVMKSNVQIEDFKNIGKNVFSQVRRVNFKNSNNKNSNNKSIAHEDEVDTCINKKYKFRNYDFAYHSKYDSTHCIPCNNYTKCSEHNYKCVNNQTGYSIQDNCVEDGTCRINEDVINMFPIKNINK